MVTRFGAVYEGGLFRPTGPVDLPEGTAVDVTVTFVPTPIPDHPAIRDSTDPEMSPGRRAFLAMKRIAEMPDEVDDGDLAVSENHDNFLYRDAHGVR